jgi:hypothetical protein
VHYLSGSLPAITLTALAPAGVARVPLASVSGSLLLLVPVPCHCTASVRRLTSMAAHVGAPAYLVATPMTRTAVLSLDSRLSSQLQADVIVALDPTGTLQDDYPERGLSALIIGAPSSVAYADHLATASNVTAIKKALSA